MRFSFKKWLAISVAVVLLAILTIWGAIELRWTRKFDAPHPQITSSSDPEIIARGRYLVFGPAACAYCHVPKEQWPRLDQGAVIPLSGNHVYRLPFGELFSPNVTPDTETGIGRRSDGELARILRHGVRADGRAALPLMEYQGLTDADIEAIISFLRSEPPVRSEVPDHRLNLLGKALMAFLITPVSASTPPPPSSPSSSVVSIERGDYLANHVASCAACHTDRSRIDGSFLGPKFAGGQKMDVADDPTVFFVPPNLTPDPATSPIGQWSEEVFVGRFLSGESTPGTPMPWGAFARMTDVDIRSIYLYLRSLEPVQNATGPVIQKKE